MPESLLRLPKVLARVGLGRACIYLRIKEGTFPSPINIGGHRVAWLESEIAGWIQAQVDRARPPSIEEDIKTGTRAGNRTRTE